METNAQQPKVAYFCMEYGLQNDLKIYAGGLGILAGDYLKGAKDHDFPIIGIGIKWKHGYSDQHIDEHGKPYVLYNDYDYEFLEDTGVTVDVTVRGRNVACKVWKLEEFGSAPLYLLDTDLPQNEDKWISGRLYGGTKDDRVAQEIVLGIGGIRALRALGIEVDLYHFNEGHALLAGFELMREEREKGASFEDAWARTKEKIVFTTHTPVVQGNESHTIDRLMYMSANLGLDWDQLMRLGGNPFNMTVGALRLSRKSNAVAQLHGTTANRMWKNIQGASEIVAITNGIHPGTWVDAAMLKAGETGKNIWESHQANKRDLIKFVEEETGAKLDENKLLIGFSRRTVPYKRTDLIFSRPEIINPLLEEQKVQFVFSGKAHPNDDASRQIVARLVELSKQFPNSVVFLENYGMTIGAKMTRGCDVWLNNPRRPKEASGTSGMKAAMNGVLNLSILDGWWPEACHHGFNGWQFGNAYESENVTALDENDRKALYAVLLEEVIPTYYDNHDQWVEMMRNSIQDTRDAFSVKRMLDEYYEHLYQM